MGTRAIYEGHVWLKRLADEPGQGRTARYAGQDVNFCSDVMYLTHDLGLLVEFGYDGSAYSMRCRPMRQPANWKGPRVAASYRGDQLKQLPMAAILDYLALQREPMGAELAPREHIRWVEWEPAHVAAGGDPGGGDPDGSRPSYTLG